MLVLALPYPCTVNHYWIQGRNNRRYISRRGIEFRNAVIAAVPAGFEALEGLLTLRVDIYPPDRRKRDIDNLSKGIGDSLQYAGVFKDDSQVNKIILERFEVSPPGRVIVTVAPYGSVL